jgi:uncharacterized protein YndB with AHSA1/START domain
MNPTEIPAAETGPVFRTERVIAASPEQIFEAFQRGELLARWWGPKGFTNTFEVFDFREGGRWKFVMHAPTGGNFQNESVFREVKAPFGLVIEHESMPRYVLTVTLAATEGGTRITWNQEFEDPAVAARIAHIVVPSNEENLDRLQTVLRAE